MLDTVKDVGVNKSGQSTAGAYTLLTIIIFTRSQYRWMNE